MCLVAVYNLVSYLTVFSGVFEASSYLDAW